MKKMLAYGFLNINNSEIPCAVLEGDVRVIIQRELVGLLTGNKKGGLERYFKPENLQPYVPERFKNNALVQVTHTFKIRGEVIAHGYDAEDVIDICDMYMQAKHDNALLPNQVQLADNAYMLIKAYAKVGLIALIDEATGYQTTRKKDALRLLVEKYIIEDARRWTKEFYDPFFDELDRLYKNQKTTSRNRPKYYGMFINKYIYKPIEKGEIFKKLIELNPSRNGIRKKRLHQFLSDKTGLRVLRDRIAKITGIMQISHNKPDFERNYARLESKQKWLDFPENDNE